MELCNIKRMDVKDQDVLLREWHNKFTTKRIDHIKVAKRYNVSYWTFGIINVILSAFGSIFSTINASEEFMGVSSNIINACIHFLVLIFSGIQHFAHFQNKEIAHINCSHQYSELNRLIEYQQTLPKSERDLKTILKKYDEINSNEPLITKCC